MQQTEMTNELLESAIIEIEQHTSKEFNDVQKRFWRDCLSQYTQEVVERSWTDFTKQLQPFRYPSWQIVEPIFKSNKEQLSYEPPVQISDQDKIYGSRIAQAVLRGLNTHNKSEYHKVLAEQFKKENEPDMVDNHLLLAEKAIKGGYDKTKKKFF
tara:strand:- start:220 stop:684 length:465 start_codon:yes stop_codon:yes gene_type:complete